MRWDYLADYLFLERWPLQQSSILFLCNLERHVLFFIFFQTSLECQFAPSSWVSHQVHPHLTPCSEACHMHLYSLCCRSHLCELYEMMVVHLSSFRRFDSGSASRGKGAALHRAERWSRIFTKYERHEIFECGTDKHNSRYISEVGEYRTSSRSSQHLDKPKVDFKCKLTNARHPQCNGWWPPYSSGSSVNPGIHSHVNYSTHNY